MKNLIRNRLTFGVAVTVGVILFLVYNTPQKTLHADQPPASTKASVPIPLPPLAANQTQILLKTTILKIDTKKLADLGIELRELTASLSPAPTKDSTNQHMIVDPGAAERFTALLVANGIMKVVAEPTIIATDGRMARFRQGGEVPLMVAQPNGKSAIKYGAIGTSLEVLPKLMAGGKLKLKINVKQTDLYKTEGAEVNGITIPVFDTSQVDTTVEFAVGKTALLRTAELLAMVTPELVALAPEVPQARPTSEATDPPSDNPLSARDSEALPVPPASKLRSEQLPEVLRELFPEADIKVYPLISSVVLTGRVDTKTLPMVIRVAEDFYPSVINHLSEEGKQRRAEDAPQPIHVAPVRPASIHDEFRGLHQDVKALRQAIEQLTQVLKEQAHQENPLDPPRDSESLESPSSKTQSSNTQVDPDVVMWDLIGIRAAPVLFEGGRYRGGLKISEVKASSPANKEGIRNGDVFLGLGKFETLDAKNVAFVLNDRNPINTNRLRFIVLRGEEPMFGFLELPVKPKTIVDHGDTSLPEADAESSSSWNLGLDAVIELALSNAKSIRNLGAVVSDTGSVVLAKNADVSIEQIEMATRDLLSDVEAAYWEVWAAKRKVETCDLATRRAQAFWVKQVDNPTSKAIEKAAREQYLVLRLQRGDATKSLVACERTLRLLMGVAASDGRAIRPTDQPKTSEVKINWPELLAEALASSPELRIQQGVIKNLRDLVSNAAKQGAVPLDGLRLDVATTKALANLKLPIGKRQELNQTRRLQLVIAREEVIYQEMEAQATAALSTAVRNLESRFAAMQEHRNRQKVAQIEETAVAELYEGGNADSSQVLAARKDGCESHLAAYEAIKEYALAIKEIRAQQGSLLKSRGIRIIAVKAKEPATSDVQFADHPVSEHLPDPALPLKPSDRLTIESLADGKLNRDVTILADGTITLPMLGQVPAEGRTLATLQEQLSERYQKHYKDPMLTLSFLGTSLPSN